MLNLEIKMQFDNFFQNDTKYIKENLINQKDIYGNTILHCLIQRKKNLKLISSIFDFTMINCSSLFLEKNINGYTFLHFICIQDLEIFKYVFDFTKRNCPNLFLEKNNFRKTFYCCILSCNRKLNIDKYIFQIIKNNIPEILSDAIIKEYFPKKNLILPLTFQIQN